MERKHWRRAPMSLYSLVLHSLIRQKNLDVSSLKCLPCHIKEDLLRLGLLRKRGKDKVCEFLPPNLTRLDTFQSEITSEDLLEISRCRRLRLLVINPRKYYRFSHSPSNLAQLFSSLPFLVKLHITNNDGVTDDVINVIKESCRLIQELDVSGSLNLTDTAAKFLAEMCHLRAIDLSETLIGDCGLETLSRGSNSKTIIYLRLNNCVNISDVGICALMKGCESLSKLKVCGWPRVSIECQLELNAFVNRHKKNKAKWMELFLN